MSPHPDSSPANNSTASPGFTLVEVLVALTLLTTALVPAFVLASNAVNLSTQIKNSLTASNLAQEGVEVVRAIRDANWFNDRAFDTGLGSCTVGCTVQYDSTSLNLSLPVKTLIKVNAGTKLYQYSSGDPSIFSRTVTITPKSDHELQVVSLVEWSERGRPKSSQVEYHLYNWLP